MISWLKKIYLLKMMLTIILRVVVNMFQIAVLGGDSKNVGKNVQ